MTQTDLGWVLLILVGVAVVLGCFAFWILTMVNAAKFGKWVWFIMVFLFPLLCVIYALFAYERGTPAGANPSRVEPRF